MQKATVGKRIGAFLLDSIILGLVVSLITSFFEDPTYAQQLAELDAAYMNGSMDYFAYLDATAALVDPNLWVKQLISIIFTAAYFIVLPFFWKDQTLGRKATKIKVVQENYQPATLKHFIIREGIGQCLFSSVFVFLGSATGVSAVQSIGGVAETILGFVLIIGFFTMLGSKKTTLYDRWSKTLTVLANTPVVNDELDIAQPKTKEEDIIDL